MRQFLKRGERLRIAIKGICSLGGGGGGGTTNTAQFLPPDYARGGWEDYINNAGAITQNPYNPYAGQEIAPLNNAQVQGMNLMAGYAGTNAPDYATARAQNQLTAAGAFEDPTGAVQTEVGMNPFLGATVNPASIGSNQYMGQTVGVGFNPFIGREYGPSENEYIGFGPKYQDMKNRAMGDFANAYATGTAAQTDSAFNRPGAFHGGAHDAQIQANQYGFGQGLGNLSEKMDMTQWQNSGGLNQQLLGLNQNTFMQDQARNLQGYGQMQGLDASTRLADLARNSQLAESGMNRGLGMQQTDLARNAQLAQEAMGMGVQAQQGDLNRYSQSWNQERNRQVGALPAAIGAQANDLTNAQRLIGIGDAQRQYQQDMLNAGKNAYGQWQQYPFQMLDAFGNVLSRASGNYGANTAQSFQNYQTNPLAALIGGGLLGAGAYQAFGS